MIINTVVVENGGSRLPTPATDAALDDDDMGYTRNNLFPRLMQECIHCVGVSYSTCTPAKTSGRSDLRPVVYRP